MNRSVSPTFEALRRELIRQQLRRTLLASTANMTERAAIAYAIAQMRRRA